MERAIREGKSGFDQAFLYVRFHVELMVSDEGPVAIMSEIPSLKEAHRKTILEVSRRHSAGRSWERSTGFPNGFTGMARPRTGYAPSSRWC
jgi:hypothetical protein